jgi:hypothetical protein
MSNVSALKARPSTTPRRAQARRPHLTVVPAPKATAEKWERLRRRLVEASLDVATTFNDGGLALQTLALRDLNPSDCYEHKAIVLVEFYEQLCLIGAKHVKAMTDQCDVMLQPGGASLYRDHFTEAANAMDLCAKAIRGLDKWAGAGK